MIIYAVAFLYFVYTVTTFYMAWFKAEAFEGFLTRMDKSLDNKDKGWQLLMIVLLGITIYAMIYSWYQT